LKKTDLSCELDFERAAKIRDRIREMKKKIMELGLQEGPKKQQRRGQKRKSRK